MKKYPSKKWIHSHINDPYVKMSKEQGYRARSAFKLIEIHEKVRLFNNSQIILELGSAPGSWSQVISRLGKKNLSIIANDILHMESLEGVNFIQGDFTQKEVQNKILNACEDKKLDVVLSDMSPNITGINIVDQMKMLELVEMVYNFTVLNISDDAKVLIKFFQGSGSDGIIKLFKSTFKKVNIIKPKASRSKSPENYLYASNLK